MGNAPTAAIKLTFLDRDQNEAQVNFYVSYGATAEQAWEVADAIAARLQVLSNALLWRIQIVWKWTADMPGPADVDSNVRRAVLVLVAGPDDAINALLIPSPRSTIFEADGRYAGIRLDLDNAAVSGFVSVLELPLLTPDGGAFGTDIITGGLSL